MQACTIPATGVCAPDRMLVAVRAIAPVAGSPPNSGDATLATPWVSVEVGMILASLLFIRKVVCTTTISEVTNEDVEDGRAHVLQDKQIPEYVWIFRIHGPSCSGRPTSSI